MGTHKQVTTRENRLLLIRLVVGIFFVICGSNTKRKKKDIHLRVSKSRENFSLAVGIMVDYLIR